MQLTEQERSTIKDLQTQEKSCAEKYTRYSDEANDPVLKSLFKELAEKCDLHIDHHPTYGWSITSPTDELVEFCIENNLTEIRLCRNDGTSLGSTGTGSAGSHSGTATGNPSRKKSSTRKYYCPCCGMSVRATKVVHIGCLDCQEPLLPAA